MTITSYQVRNILRTYARQLSRAQRLARLKQAGAREQASDQVNISIEARRRQIIEKITAEIVANISSRLPGLRDSWGAVEQEAMNKLSQEYGRPLTIYQDEATGRLRFAVVDPASGGVLERLSAEESAQLEDRLYAITQDIIDRNML